MLPKEENELQFSIGLDIGTSSCKAVLLDKKSENKYDLIKWVEMLFTEEDREDSIKAAIQSLGEKGNICIGVSGEGTLVHRIPVPKMKESLLKQSFDIECDKYFPFTGEDAYVDCHVLSRNRTSSQMDVIAGASKKHFVDDRLRVLNNIDLSSDCIGLDSIALINAYTVLGCGKNKSSSKDFTVILDVGGRGSILAVIDGEGAPRLVRYFTTGGQKMTEYIKKALGLDDAKAEDLKIQWDDQNGAVNTACQSVFSDIVREIEVSFEYFMERKNIKVRQIVLMGGASMCPGFIEFLQEKLSVEVSFWRPEDSLNISKDLDLLTAKQNLPKLAVAIGLALNTYD